MILFLVTGCTSELENEEQKIEVQKRIVEENRYKDFKEVSDNEKVRKVKDVLDGTDWENKIVNMARNADYRFVFQYKNPEIEAKTVLYEFWINPQGEKLEIVQSNQYALLTKENSELLYKIITGEKLSDLEEKGEEWKVSPSFTISKPDSNGKDVPYGLKGVNGKLAIVDAPIKAGINNKQLFHFLGGTPEETGRLH